MKYRLQTVLLHPTLGFPGFARPDGSFPIVFFANRHGLTSRDPELEQRWEVHPWAKRPAPPAGSLIPGPEGTGDTHRVQPWKAPGERGIALQVLHVRAAHPHLPDAAGRFRRKTWPKGTAWWRERAAQEGILFSDPGEPRRDGAGAFEKLRVKLLPEIIDLFLEGMTQTIRLYFATVKPAKTLPVGMHCLTETNQVASDQSEAVLTRTVLARELPKRLSFHQIQVFPALLQTRPNLMAQNDTLPIVRANVRLIDLKKVERLDAEIVPLHPLQVGTADRFRTLGHLTDTHVDRRHEYFRSRGVAGFNNFNDRFYEHVRENAQADAVVVTGDLIDFNMGHDGVSRPTAKPPYPGYCYNGNWRFFHGLLVNCYDGRYAGMDVTTRPAGEKPGPPIFTTLGNHDYRPFPYAPKPRALGYDLYDTSADMNLLDSELPALDPEYQAVALDALVNHRAAVLWYNAVINPFIDYSFRYGRTSFLALDWAEAEELDIGVTISYYLSQRKSGAAPLAFPPTDPLPRADAAYTPGQIELVRLWVADSAKSLHRIVASHVPVFSPRPDTGDAVIKPPRFDWRVAHRPEAPGDKRDTLLYGVAVQRRVPGLGPGGEPASQPNLVDLVRRGAQTGVTLFLTGHSHRNGVFQIDGNAVRALTNDEVKDGSWQRRRTRILFVVTVSSGPLGFENRDGDPKERFQGLLKRRLVPPGYRFVELAEQDGKPLVRMADCFSKEATALPAPRREVQIEYIRPYFPGSLPYPPGHKPPSRQDVRELD